MGLAGRSPLAAREFYRFSLRRDVYLYRFVVLGLMALGVGLGSTDPQLMTQWLDGLVRVFQVVVVCLIAPALAIEGIQRESRDGTLDFLVLASGNGRDVIWAKSLPPFVSSGVLLAGTLPLEAFATFMGGVSVPGVAAAVAVQLAWTAVATSCGVLCAASAATRGGATFLGYVLLGALLLVYRALQAAVPGALFLPLFPRPSNSFPPSFAAFASSGAFALVATAAVVYGATRTLRNGKSQPEGTRAAVHGATRFYMIEAREFLERVPAVRGATAGYALAAFGACCLLTPLSFLYPIGWIVCVCVCVAHGANLTGRIRGSEEIQPLLLTSLDDDEVSRALINQVRLRALAFVPAGMVSLAGPMIAAAMAAPAPLPVIAMGLLFLLSVMATLFCSAYAVHEALRNPPGARGTSWAVLKQGLLHALLGALQTVLISAFMSVGGDPLLYSGLAVWGVLVIGPIVYFAGSRIYGRRCGTDFRGRFLYGRGPAT